MLLYMELLESERIGYKEYAHLARNPIIVLRTIHTRQGMTVRSTSILGEKCGMVKCGPERD